MKIVLLTATPPGTGPASHMISLAKGFEKYGKEVPIIYLRNKRPNSKVSKHKNSSTPIYIKFLKELFFLLSSFMDIKVNFLKIVLESDVVIVRGGIDVWAPVLISKLQRKHVLYEIDAPLTSNSIELQKWLFPKIPEFIDRINRNFSDTLIFVSKETIKCIINNGDEISKNYLLLPNGVHEKNILKKPKTISGKLKIAFMGSFHEWHGIIELCDTIDMIAKDGIFTDLVEWHFMGDGDCRNFVIEKTKLHSNVFYHGWITSEEKIDQILSSCHIGIAPYRKIYNFYFSPLKIYRYLSNAMACIATGQGQIIGLIDDNNGWLLNNPSPEEIKKSVHQAISDRSLVDKKRFNALQKIQPFTWENNARKILETLK